MTYGCLIFCLLVNHCIFCRCCLPTLIFLLLSVIVEVLLWVWSDKTVTVTPKLHRLWIVFSLITFLYRRSWTVLSEMYQKVREYLTVLEDIYCILNHKLVLALLIYQKSWLTLIRFIDYRYWYFRFFVIWGLFLVITVWDTFFLTFILPKYVFIYWLI